MYALDFYPLVKTEFEMIFRRHQLLSTSSLEYESRVFLSLALQPVSSLAELAVIGMRNMQNYEVVSLTVPNCKKMIDEDVSSSFIRSIR